MKRIAFAKQQRRAYSLLYVETSTAFLLETHSLPSILHFLFISIKF